MTDVLERPEPRTKPEKPRTALRADGMPVGRPFPPGVPSGPGRPPIPAWLRERTDDLLRLQLMAAERGILPQANPDDPDNRDADTHVIVQSRFRVQALENLLDRLMGRPAQHQEPPEGSDSLASLIVRLATSQPPIK